MIRETHSSYNVVAKSHPGSTGKNNEDRFGVSAFRLNQTEKEIALLAVLCDGIGGHQAGEVAAELAVNTISDTFANSNGSNPQLILEHGIHLANQAIFEAAKTDFSKRGMGSTCACAFLINNQLYTATVGDSRVYLMHEGHIHQVSIDHTWIEEALEAGLITPDQVRNHPNRHVIRRYLGAPQPPLVDFRLRLHKGESDEKAQKNQGLELQGGDRLLLCSDGLTDLVSDAEILAAFDYRGEEKAVDWLIELANQRGGHDNITIVSVLVPQTTGKKKQKQKQKKKRVFSFGCITAVMLGLLIGLSVGYFWWTGLLWEIQLPWWNTSTPPVQETLNPFITSAPQPSATSGPTRTLPPTRTPTETQSSSELFITNTPQNTRTPQTGETAYPAPDALGTATAYP